MTIPYALITLATAIVSAAIALVGAYISSRESLKRLQKQLAHENDTETMRTVRVKREELYVLVCKYTTTLATNLLPYAQMANGELSYDQILDMTLKRDKEDRPDFARLQMLVDLYLPEVKEEMRLLLEARDQGNKVMSQIVREYQQGRGRSPEIVQPVFDKVDIISQAGDRLRDAVAASGRQ